MRFIACAVWKQEMSDAHKYNFLCAALRCGHEDVWPPGEHVEEASQMTKALSFRLISGTFGCLRSSS